ncbi:hypothetical protein WDU94_008128 [Cyamophila willieti]
MAEINQGHVYSKNLRVLEKVMGLMFNNIKYSDTVFTVKEQKFYALGPLLAASSTILESIMSSHYEHCYDKYITIPNVKHSDSFMIILKYIYGLKIDFNEMNIAVLCEVLSLSYAYQLFDFTKDLKVYLSNLNHFQLESAVLLMNTAKNYDIPELYKQITMFAYNNSNEIVKHESFQHLGHSVLIDLLKSDWFNCSEIDILKSVLIWHSSDIGKERIKMEETLKKKNVNEHEKSGIAEQTNQAEEMEIQSYDEKECVKRDQIDSNERGECSLAHVSKKMKTSISEKILVNYQNIIYLFIQCI